METLVADIGGTHARFAIPNRDGSQHIELRDARQYDVAAFPTLEHALRHYLDDIHAPGMPRRVALSVASPVTDEYISITNNPWRFSLTELRRSLGIGHLEAINDFAAISYAISRLGSGDVMPIGRPAQGQATGGIARSLAIVGPGTGLGVGAVVEHADGITVISSEGGHIGFAPGNPYEIRILDHLMSRFGRVSAERILSGPGLVNLYQAVCAIENKAVEPLAPEDITSRASLDPQGVTGRTVRLFCEILGSVAGDVALLFGAWDGVYLAGGIAPKLMPWLTAGGFRERFEAKGRFEETMSAVPTLVIIHPYVGLLGAAAYLNQVL